MNHTTLIDAAELARHLDDPGCVVFDCRHDLMRPQAGAAAYAVSHLPNARFAHCDRDLAAPLTGRNGRHPLPEPAVFSSWLAAMGVSNDVQVIGYDDAGGVYASRLWWMLRWLGHGRVAVLDGGWQAWTAAGYPVTSAPPRIVPARFEGRLGNAAVDVEQVLRHLGSDAMVVLDARSADRFRGENETIDPVAGHIPGARNRFFKANLDERGRFKSAAELRAEFVELLGDTPAGRVVHQCGSGVTACHNALAMEIAGLSGSRVYAGSWSEWIADPSRLIAR